MKIAPFAVEEWMNQYETQASCNIAETCVDSISLEQLLALCGAPRQEFLDQLASRRLTYGDIVGAPGYLEGICGLYRTIRPDQIIATHGAAGANHLIFYSLTEPGDRVISVLPTYQQLYSIPASFGAKVELLRLREENGWLPDLGELRRMAAGGVKMICINNPNNPTGALMDQNMLEEIVGIAREAGAWLLCDEVYRGLNQDGGMTASVADLYEKGISVSSMSKVFSMAGIRLGWIATRDDTVRRACLSHRDYSLISCGMLDEQIAALVLQNKEKILARNIELVKTNLGLLLGWVKENPKFSLLPPKAGTTALIRYDFDLDSASFCRGLLEQTGALVVPGDCFGEEKSFRLGYGCGTRELQEGLAKLSDYAEGLA